MLSRALHSMFLRQKLKLANICERFAKYVVQHLQAWAGYVTGILLPAHIWAGFELISAR